MSFFCEWRAGFCIVRLSEGEYDVKDENCSRYRSVDFNLIITGYVLEVIGVILLLAVYIHLMYV